METGAVTACSRTVAFAWEHEPGVSKLKSPVVEAEKPSGGGRTTPAASRWKKAEAQTPHRLRVPPPPGGPGAPVASPPARSRPSRRAVRPEEDPFLAAYIACTASGRKTERGHQEARKLLGWPGLRRGLRLGFGLSCKSSCGVAEEGVVRLGKIPEVTDR